MVKAVYFLWFSINLCLWKALEISIVVNHSLCPNRLNGVRMSGITVEIGSIQLLFTFLTSITTLNPPLGFFTRRTGLDIVDEDRLIIPDFSLRVTQVVRNSDSSTPKDLKYECLKIASAVGRRPYAGGGVSI